VVLGILCIFVVDGCVAALLSQSIPLRQFDSERVRRAAQPRFAFRHEFTFATMSDGVEIALAVGYPEGLDPRDTTRRWPTIFSTCGYPFATEPMNPEQFGNRYVTVNASLRGTGASGGMFGPFDERTKQDGYEIIENWIVKQPSDHCAKAESAPSAPRKRERAGPGWRYTRALTVSIRLEQRPSGAPFYRNQGGCDLGWRSQRRTMRASQARAVNVNILEAFALSPKEHLHRTGTNRIPQKKTDTLD
jgi:hypothetical protein